jgi:hypothetical protein
MDNLSAIIKGMKASAGLKAWIEVRNPKTGELLLVTPNTIVNGGLALAALLLGDATAEPILEACIGEGVTAAAITDVALESEVDTQTPAFSRVQTAVANDTAQFVSLHTAPGGGWAITEYGIKTAIGHLLFNHVVFAALNLAENNQLEFTYKIQVQRVV